MLFGIGFSDIFRWFVLVYYMFSLVSWVFIMFMVCLSWDIWVFSLIICFLFDNVLGVGFFVLCC